MNEIHNHYLPEVPDNSDHYGPWCTHSALMSMIGTEFNTLVDEHTRGTVQ